MEECLLYKQEVGGSIPPSPNDITILVFNKIYFIMIYYGYRGFQTVFVCCYEGGSTLPSYVTIRGVLCCYNGGSTLPSYVTMRGI